MSAEYSENEIISNIQDRDQVINEIDTIRKRIHKNISDIESSFTKFNNALSGHFNTIKTDLNEFNTILNYDDSESNKLKGIQGHVDSTLKKVEGMKTSVNLLKLVSPMASIPSCNSA